MKSRTSFFNIHVLRKNLARFAPLWVLYTIAEVLCLMSLELSNGAGIADDLVRIIGPVSIFHAGYALIVAACLFGDLFQSRMCNGLHAMPMRREGWLLTNLVSGFVFALIPAFAGGAVAAVTMGKFWWVALVWQGASLLQFLFFFGVAVFSAMCAGNRLGMAAIYAIVNFLPVLLYWMTDMIYEPLLQGVILNIDAFTKFCPLVNMVGHKYADIYYDKILGVFFRGFYPESWGYLWLCAAIGAVCLGLSLLLYRKRQLECAGDFVSFRPVGFVFLLAYTLFAGTVLYSFGDLIGSVTSYSFLAVGIAIGWFTGWMLLERTVKIFSRKVLLGFGIFVLAFTGTLGLTALDPAGVETFVPEQAQVEMTALYFQNDRYIYENDADEQGWYITDPAEIALVQELHRQMLQQRSHTDGEVIPVGLQYKLKNGRTVYREYDVPVNAQVTQQLQTFFSDPRALFHTDDWQQVKDTADYAGVYIEPSDGTYQDIWNLQQIEALLKAIEADCAAGNFNPHNQFHNDGNWLGTVEIRWKADWGYTHGYITVYRDCENLLAAIEEINK